MNAGPEDQIITRRELRDINNLRLGVSTCQWLSVVFILQAFALASIATLGFHQWDAMNTLNFSQRTQLIATAVAASLVTAGLLQAYNGHTRRTKRRELDREIKRSLAAHDFPNTNERDGDASSSPLSTEDGMSLESSRLGQTSDYDENLIREQLARNYAFFGEEGMRKVRQGRVVVVGCGGVGSWAAVMLVRSCVSLMFVCGRLEANLVNGYSSSFCFRGVSNIRLVDFDYVTLSSLNRHATATLSDVGTPKVKCIEKTLKQIAKWVEVDSRIEIWRKDEGGNLLEGADWVIGLLNACNFAQSYSFPLFLYEDAIDNIQTKVDLLKYCHDNGIKVFITRSCATSSDE